MKKDYIYILIIATLVSTIGFLVINNKNKDNDVNSNSNNSGNSTSNNVSTPSHNPSTDTNQGINTIMKVMILKKNYGKVEK